MKETRSFYSAMTSSVSRKHRDRTFATVYRQNKRNSDFGGLTVLRKGVEQRNKGTRQPSEIAKRHEDDLRRRADLLGKA